MKFSCEQCGTRYSIADQKVEGKRLRIRCKVCNYIMDVRGTPRHLIEAKVSRSETVVQAAQTYRIKLTGTWLKMASLLVRSHFKR